MSNPRLRIALVDSDATRRMSIEKDLGHLGYHRVVPVDSLKVLITLLDNARDVFDLLVINEETVRAAGAQFKQMLEEYACVRHSLIYQGVTLQAFPDNPVTAQRCGFIASGVPDRSILARVMNRVDVQIKQRSGRPLLESN